jgi:hypothetical protein
VALVLEQRPRQLTLTPVFLTWFAESPRWFEARATKEGGGGPPIL